MGGFAMIRCGGNQYRKYFQLSVFSPQDLSVSSESLELPFDEDEIGVSGGSCGGLLYFHGEKGQIVIYNSKFQQLKVFPPPVFDPLGSFGVFRVSGLGYDAKSGDYKLLRCYDQYYSKEAEDGVMLFDGVKRFCQLYSFKRGSWKKITIPKTRISNGTSVYIEETGSCYWKAEIFKQKQPMREYRVLSFDCATERFNHFPVPATNFGDWDTRYKLVQHRGSLGALVYGNPEAYAHYESGSSSPPPSVLSIQLFVWKYKERLWSLLYVVPRSLLADVERPISGLKDDWLFLEAKAEPKPRNCRRSQLMVYNLVDESLEKLDIYDYPGCMSGISYAESTTDSSLPDSFPKTNYEEEQEGEEEEEQEGEGEEEENTFLETSELEGEGEEEENTFLETSELEGEGEGEEDGNTFPETPSVKASIAEYETRNGMGGFAVTHLGGNDCPHLSLVSLEDWSVTENLNIPFNVNEAVSFGGSCCGMLCFHSQKGQIALCIVENNEWVVFPPPLQLMYPLHQGSLLASGLGYVAKSGDYKLITICKQYYLNEKDAELGIVRGDGSLRKDYFEMLSLKCGSMKEIKKPTLDCDVRGCTCVYVDKTGSCYWEASFRNSLDNDDIKAYLQTSDGSSPVHNLLKNHVLSFDFATESFDQFPFPQTTATGIPDFKLVECQASLGVFVSSELSSSIQLFLWKREERSWKWLLDFSQIDNVNRPLGLKDDRWLFVEAKPSDGRSQVMVYDLGSKTLKKLDIYDKPGYMSGISYTEISEDWKEEAVRSGKRKKRSGKGKKRKHIPGKRNTAGCFPSPVAATGPQISEEREEEEEEAVRSEKKKKKKMSGKGKKRKHIPGNVVGESSSQQH